MPDNWKWGLFFTIVLGLAGWWLVCCALDAVAHWWSRRRALLPAPAADTRREFYASMRDYK